MRTSERLIWRLRLLLVGWAFVFIAGVLGCAYLGLDVIRFAVMWNVLFFAAGGYLAVQIQHAERRGD